MSYDYENWKKEAKEFWEKAPKNIVCDEDEVIKNVYVWLLEI